MAEPFIAAALVTASIISLLAFRFIGSPNEKLLRAENERMKDRYRELNKETKKIEQQMKELEDRDNEVYRSIFEASPIPDSARLKELEKEQQIAKVEGMDQDERRDRNQHDLQDDAAERLAHGRGPQPHHADDYRLDEAVLRGVRREDVGEGDGDDRAEAEVP